VYVPAPPQQEIEAMKTVQGRNHQRGFLAFGLGVALFAVYSGIGAGVVANKDGGQDVTQTPQSEALADVNRSGPSTRPRVKLHRDS
jgi:hypothetical protein